MGFLDYFHDDGSETKCCCYCSDMRQMFPKSLKIKTFKAILTIIIIIIKKKLATVYFLSNQQQSPQLRE